MTDTAKEAGMWEYSTTAWNIASRYSNVLASETRDLAAQIDKALTDERAALLHLQVQEWTHDQLMTNAKLVEIVRAEAQRVSRGCYFDSVEAQQVYASMVSACIQVVLELVAEKREVKP